jgi:hypothetical protein
MTGTESRNIDRCPEDERVLYFHTVVDGITYQVYPEAVYGQPTAVGLSCLGKINRE